MEKNYIKLDSFLKYKNIVSSGGEAKMLIQEGNVLVNNEIELRRGKKLVNGDEVEIFGEIFKVEIDFK